MVGKFFGKFSEGGNFRNVFENSEKYPLPKDTRFTVYGKLPRLSDKIAARRLRLAGHCQRHPELGAHRLILWEPNHGQQGRGRPRTTFVDQLKRDTGTTTTGELAAMMKDRKIGRKAVDSRLRSSK